MSTGFLAQAVPGNRLAKLLLRAGDLKIDLCQRVDTQSEHFRVFSEFLVNLSEGMVVRQRDSLDNGS